MLKGLIPFRRDSLKNPGQWLIDWFSGGAGTYTGKAVSHDNALQYIPLLAGIRKIAETTGSLPLFLYKRVGQGKERAVDHPLYDILHVAPNSEMTSMKYRETIAGHLLFWGDSFSEIDWAEGGYIKGLWPLFPSRMILKRINGELLYCYTPPYNATEIIYRQNQILHISGFGTTGHRGLSMVNQGREAIGLGMGLEEFGARYFGDGAHPGSVLEHPGSLSDKAQERIIKRWNKSQGLIKAHSTVVLEEGMKLHEYTVNPQAAQTLETRKFQVTEIARLLNIQPHKIADLERATFSNIEESNIDWVVDTLRPWLVRIEQAMSMQLLTREERKVYFIEHLVEGLLRGNITSRYQAYSTARNGGWMNADEIREKENMNPMPDGKGEIYLVQGAMAPLEEGGKVGAPLLTTMSAEEATEIRSIKSLIKDINNIRESYVEPMEDVFRRILNREIASIQRALKKHLENRGVTGFSAWLSEYYNDLPESIQKASTPLMRAYMQLIYKNSAQVVIEPKDIPSVMPKQLNQFREEYIETMAKRYVGSSIGQLQNLVKMTPPAELYKTIEQRLNEWIETRPAKVTHKELVKAQNAMCRETYKFVGITKLRWVAQGGSCEFCQQFNGKVVGIEQHFADHDQVIESKNPKTPNFKVSQPKLHPPLHRGCVCIIVPER